MVSCIVLFAAAVTATPVATAPTAVAIMAEVERLARRELWPGFDPRRVPVAIFDGENTWLFHHPSPPAAFAAVPGTAGLATIAGRHPDLVANSSTTLGGSVTATFLMDATARGSLAERAALIVHETFHVFQGRRHPTWRANEADLFTYPTDDVPTLALRVLETRALRRALLEPDPGGAASWAAAAIALRRARFSRLPLEASAYERGTELYEGLATSVENQVAPATPAGVLPRDDFGADSIRQRGYRSGLAFALLLDRLAPGWTKQLEGGDTRPLDEMLLDALARAGADPAEFDDEERAAAWQIAEDAVAALLKSRTSIREAFAAAPGWKLVVESPASPLRPQGFDPLNVALLSSKEILHSRWLKLGNGADTFEVLGRAALTEGAGVHPLFSGVTRVTVTGLDSEPAVARRGHAITLAAPGVTGTLAKARVEKSGRTVTITIEP